MSPGKFQACNACQHIKLQCSLVPSGVRQQKRKAGDDSDNGVQLKRLKVVIEVPGPSQGMRLALTSWGILLEQLEMLGEVQDLLVKHLKEVKEIRRGQEDLRRQVAGLKAALDDIMENDQREER